VCPNQITLAPQACSASTTTSSGCQQCWGSSDCCADFQAGAYSDPTCKSSGEPNCPSDTLCRGGNCPATVACDYEGSEELCTQGSKCWGRLTCTGGPAGCPPGYEEGQFCFQAGGSQQFKVCCDTLPTPPEAPAPAPERLSQSQSLHRHLHQSLSLHQRQVSMPSGLLQVTPELRGTTC
jgi:hypothetical protein